MARTAERPDGYSTSKVAQLWHLHITEAHDPFRENPGGLYDRIDSWVEENKLGIEHEIIDVCCGQGVTSVVASKKGPFVTGVDISEPLIEIAYRENQGSTDVRFYTGDAANLFWIRNQSVDAGMMINGIFHLYPGTMEGAVSELARVTRGPVMITTVAPDANEFFSSLFENQVVLYLDEENELGPTKVIIGDPSVNGPNGTQVVLKNTPFVMHPTKKLERAFDDAGFKVADYTTFGPVSDVGGPEGLDLFAAIELDHQ